LRAEERDFTACAGLLLRLPSCFSLIDLYMLLDACQAHGRGGRVV